MLIPTVRPHYIIPYLVIICATVKFFFCKVETQLKVG